jgi:hypothetical protein
LEIPVDSTENWDSREETEKHFIPREGDLGFGNYLLLQVNLVNHRTFSSSTDF